jgi:hypothetical protein
MQIAYGQQLLLLQNTAPSLYIFNQTEFAFQPSNQQQGEVGQQQEEILLLSSSSSSNDSFHSVTNTNTRGHPSSSSPLQDLQGETTTTMTVEIVLGALLCLAISHMILIL